MRKNRIEWRTDLEMNQSVEGVCMEENLRRISEAKTGIAQQFEMIYTDRRDGVLPQYDIRTDRFEIAREAKDKLNKFEASKAAKGENVAKTEPAEEEPRVETKPQEVESK